MKVFLQTLDIDFVLEAKKMYIKTLYMIDCTYLEYYAQKTQRLGNHDDIEIWQNNKRKLVNPLQHKTNPFIRQLKKFIYPLV